MKLRNCKTLHIIFTTLFLVIIVVWILINAPTFNTMMSIKQQNIHDGRQEYKIDLVASRMHLLDDMKKVDRNYDFKVPIEFYGKVLDQHDNPVPKAEIQLSINTINGITNQSIYSHEDGSFSLSGVKGKFLTVNVFGREGYAGVHSTGYGDYNYAIPGEFNFHVPNSNNPVIFKIWKYGTPEPIERKTIYTNVKPDGTIGWIDMQSGSSGIRGMGISVVDHLPGNKKKSYVTYKVISGDGCGIIETSDDPMFMPPDKGFTKEIIHEAHWMEGQSSQIESGKFRFYIKYADNSYGAVMAEMRFASEDKCDVTLCISHNPSGSRNLEYDPKIKSKTTGGLKTQK